MYMFSTCSFQLAVALFVGHFVFQLSLYPSLNRCILCKYG